MENNDSLFALKDKKESDFCVSKQDDSDELITKRNKRKKVALIVASVALVLVVVVSLVGLFVFNPFSKSNQPQSNDEYEAVYDITKDPDAKFYQKKPNPNPNAKDWEDYTVHIDDKGNMTAYSRLNEKNDDYKKVVLDGVNPAIWSATGVLPSEAAGFTADLSQELNSDGSLNPMFAYWTQEEVAYELSIITESFLNPRFGNWVGFTTASVKANESFKPDEKMMALFSDRYLQANKGNPPSKWVPIFADWNANDYGLKDKFVDDDTGIARFYGTITSATMNYSYDKSNGQYNADFVASVRFLAWDKNQKTIEKTGTLKLKLVSNANNVANKFSPYRLVVDDASLLV